MTDIKLAIIGSRTFDDYDFMVETIDRLMVEHDWNVTLIVSGAANGADKLGARLAKANNIPLKEFPADWDTHGKMAGYIRNQFIVDAADVVVAFHDGFSKGTLHSIALCQSQNKQYFVIPFKAKIKITSFKWLPKNS